MLFNEKAAKKKDKKKKKKKLAISVSVQLTSKDISRRYTLQSLLIIKNKTRLVKRIWLLVQLT